METTLEQRLAEIAAELADLMYEQNETSGKLRRYQSNKVHEAIRNIQDAAGALPQDFS